MSYIPYRPRGTGRTLAEILGTKKQIPAKPYKISYSSADINAAKTVLDRLLAQASCNEVSYISEVPREIEEE
jgi:hypothetical protein